MNKAEVGFLTKNKKRLLIGMATALFVVANPSSFYNLAFAGTSTATSLSDSDVSFLKEAVQDLNIRVSLTSVAGFKGSEDALGVGQQNLGVTISNQNKQNMLLYDVLKKNLGKEKGYDLDHGFFMQIRLAGTISPLLVRDKVQKDANKIVDAEVEAAANEKRQAMYAMAPQLVADSLRAKVSAAVNGNPALSLLTEGQKAQLIAGQVKLNLPGALQAGVPLVKQKIDAQVAQALPGIKAAQEEEHVGSRLGKLETETEFQTLDATFGIPINPFGEMSEKPPGLLLFGFGKAHTMLGAELKPNGMSQWENVIGHSSEAERGNTVASTGYASLGVAYSVNKDLNLLVNFIGYHDRDPWMSAQQYIQHSLAVAREVFDKYQNPAALNALGISMRADAKLSTNLTGQFWATITDRFDPNKGDKTTGYSFGGTVVAEKSKTMLNFAYANSGKAYFNQTYSVGIAQTVVDKEKNTWTPGLILFTDFRGIKHLSDVNVAGSANTEKKLVAIGAKVDICKYVDTNLGLDCALVGEYQKIVQSSGSTANQNDDFYVGLTANARYNGF